MVCGCMRGARRGAKSRLVLLPRVGFLAFFLALKQHFKPSLPHELTLLFLCSFSQIHTALMCVRRVLVLALSSGCSSVFVFSVLPRCFGCGACERQAGKAKYPVAVAPVCGGILLIIPQWEQRK